ncbi:MAG: magnesium transporter [Deltaproteobacteria bacterium]|nr:magnesium transporter [Deltaproteobacteria bacterium]
MRLSSLIVPDLDASFAADPEAVAELFEELHVEDVADIVEAAERPLAVQMLVSLGAERAAEILECVEPELQVALVEQLGVERAVPIVHEMASDDRADFITELPEPLKDALLAKMDPEEVADVRSLVAWEDGTVGSLMSTDVLEVPVSMRVAEVIDRVRTHGEEAETVYYVYVLSSTGQLAGVVSLRELILAKPEDPVAQIMREEVKTVRPELDAEEAAQLVQHYDLIALPVVDDRHRLVGLVTVDDLADALAEEVTEDMHRMGAVQPLEDSYFGTGFWTFVKKRAPWLVALFAGELFTGDALEHFDDVIKQATVLVFFLPLIISSGGNSGSQSATLIIRALAVGEVSLSQAWRVLRRELAMGLALGLLLSTIGVLRALIWGDGPGVAATVGVTLIAVVTLGTVVGSMLPILLERVGLDPAVSSTPFIASLVDMMGILTYFSLARWILL